MQYPWLYGYIVPGIFTTSNHGSCIRNLYPVLDMIIDKISVTFLNNNIVHVYVNRPEAMNKILDYFGRGIVIIYLLLLPDASVFVVT